MKINEIITEDFDPYKPYDLNDPSSNRVNSVRSPEELVQVIEDNCGQMLAACRKAKRYLYRGIKDDTGDAQSIITAIRPDRRALTLRADQHNDLEKLFNMAGLRANRTNSIFCTTNTVYADSWGTVFAIFVKDGWEGTVFENVQRSYSYYPLKNIIQSDMISGKEKLRKFKDLRPMVVTPKNLASVLVKGYEDILITGESYIGIKTRSNLLQSVSNVLDIL